MIKRQRDFRLEKYHCETPIGVSLTLPDESYSVRDILEKYTTGIDLREQLMRQPSYDSGASFDSEDLEKLQREDLYEQQQHIEKSKIFQEKHKAKQTQQRSQIAVEAAPDALKKETGKKSEATGNDEGSSKSDG